VLVGDRTMLSWAPVPPLHNASRRLNSQCWSCRPSQAQLEDSCRSHDCSIAINCTVVWSWVVRSSRCRQSLVRPHRKPPISRGCRCPITTACLVNHPQHPKPFRERAAVFRFSSRTSISPATSSFALTCWSDRPACPLALCQWTGLLRI
jgi:hypothetical protein